jgi:hypothetical protein
MDAIGWREVDGAPDEQRITLPGNVVHWAAAEAEDVASGMREEYRSTDDVQLLALSALRRVAEAS